MNSFYFTLALWDLTTNALLIVAAVLLLVELVLWLVVRRSIRELRSGADRFARGDLGRKVALEPGVPLYGLAQSLNAMAAQLDERIQTAVQQRNELQAILSSMIEGVLVVDLQEQVISVNRAAARLLAVDRNACEGASMQQVVRNTTLLRFISQSLHNDQPLQEEFSFRVPSDAAAPTRAIEAQSASLRNAQGKRIGAVVVLHDVTELRRLEGVRRDFVANVSHEIKTPVTAIKGFCETLLDGSEHDPADAERFLQIIGRQAERLHAIVDDVLTLSRIEEDAESGEIETVSERIAAVLENAREVCSLKANEKQITIVVQCSSELQCTINGPLLEQAIVNLLDNAVKYSPAGQTVRINAELVDRQVRIEVIDAGSGISAEHLPRLFERFYRTDKARSRELGGTGLGLAIVKHIVHAHGGRIEVESEPNRGSTFTIFLPCADKG